MDAPQKMLAEPMASLHASFIEQARREKAEREASQAQAEAERKTRDDSLKATIAATIKAFAGKR